MRDGEKYTKPCTTCSTPTEFTYDKGFDEEFPPLHKCLSCIRAEGAAEERRKKRNKAVAWAVGIAVAGGLFVFAGHGAGGDDRYNCDPMYGASC
jgi:hypothetical protein